MLVGDFGWNFQVPIITTNEITRAGGISIFGRIVRAALSAPNASLTVIYLESDKVPTGPLFFSDTARMVG